MGGYENEARSGRSERSTWRRGVLAALLPLGLLAWQVDPALVEPGAPPAPAPAVVVEAPAPEPLPEPSFLPPPPSALAPRVPQHVARVSIELPPRHRRSFLAQTFAAAAMEEVAAAADSPLALPVVDGPYPLGLPDNPLTDLRPLYFIDGPGGGFALRHRHPGPPVPVPEPGTAALVLLGIGASGVLARRAR